MTDRRWRPPARRPGRPASNRDDRVGGPALDSCHTARSTISAMASPRANGSLPRGAAAPHAARVPSRRPSGSSPPTRTTCSPSCARSTSGRHPGGLARSRSWRSCAAAGTPGAGSTCTAGGRRSPATSTPNPRTPGRIAGSDLRDAVVGAVYAAARPVTVPEIYRMLCSCGVAPAGNRSHDHQRRPASADRRRDRHPGGTGGLPGGTEALTSSQRSSVIGHLAGCGQRLHGLEAARGTWRPPPAGPIRDPGPGDGRR